MPLQSIPPHADQSFAELSGILQPDGRQYLFTPSGSAEAIPAFIGVQRVIRSLLLGQPCRLGGWVRFNHDGTLRQLLILYCTAATGEPQQVAIQGEARTGGRSIEIVPNPAKPQKPFWVFIPEATLTAGLRYRIEGTIDGLMLRAIAVSPIGGEPIPPKPPCPKPTKAADKPPSTTERPRKPAKTVERPKPQKPQPQQPAGKPARATLARGKHRVEIR